MPIARRLSSVSGLYAYLIARGDTPVLVNPVPDSAAGAGARGTLPRILQPAEADRLLGALRTHRDTAMLLAGLRRCEVLGLQLEDVQVADRRLVVVEGKCGHHRVVPVANQFFDAPGGYPHDERPEAACTSRVFVVLKGPRRGQPLSGEGLDEVPGRRPPPRRPGSCHLPRAARTRP